MMPEKLPVIHSDPEILSGTPVFVGPACQCSHCSTTSRVATRSMNS